MIKKLKDLKGSATQSSDPFERDFKAVEAKVKQNIQPTLIEVRRWFIYKMEKEYNTVMLGTNWAYCNKTLNAIKSKYDLDNVQLVNKLDTWSKAYRQEYNDTFDFSKLNTNWLVEKLNNTPSYQVIDDGYTPDTSNRRI